MIRFVLVALAVIAVWVLLLKLFREMKRPNVDWTGIAVIAGFIAMALYLHHVTGIG